MLIDDTVPGDGDGAVGLRHGLGEVTHDLGESTPATTEANVS